MPEDSNTDAGVTFPAEPCSVLWTVVPHGDKREWLPGEIALIGGGTWWKRAFILGHADLYKGERYLVVSESAEYFDMIHPGWLFTVDSARSRQEDFRDELTGKMMREMLERIDALAVAPRPEWWEHCVRSWCFETHHGLGPEWVDSQYGKENMDRLRATISPNAKSQWAAPTTSNPNDKENHER